MTAQRSLKPPVILVAALTAGAVATLVLTIGDLRATAPAAPPSVHVYVVDVEGWYQITPREAVVNSPFDFHLGSMHAIPSVIGTWRGAPREFGGYASEVDKWFENPDLALSSIMTDAVGQPAWFSVFGSAGRKSYVLFEHTPVTSYPANGWSLLDSRVVGIPVSGGEVGAQRALLVHNTTGERRIVYYWYVWPDVARDPERGLLTMRLHIPVVTTDDAADRAGWDFIRALFPTVLSWHRF